MSLNFETFLSRFLIFQAIIVEPWFNSAVEEQAMDRIYRIGQTRAVRIVRLVMKDSLEERMLTKVQEAKASPTLNVLFVANQSKHSYLTIAFLYLSFFKRLRSARAQCRSCPPKSATKPR